MAAIDADLATWFTKAPFAEAVARLAAYRGITPLGALTLASEVCDRRRFPIAAMFMGFCGLVPSEHSSGERTSRGGITHAGNTHLRPSNGRDGMRRHPGVNSIPIEPDEPPREANVGDDARSRPRADGADRNAEVCGYVFGCQPAGEVRLCRRWCWRYRRQSSAGWHGQPPMHSSTTVRSARDGVLSDFDQRPVEPPSGVRARGPGWWASERAVRAPGG